MMVNDISSGTDREVPNLSAMPDLNFLELLTLMAARAADLVGARLRCMPCFWTSSLTIEVATTSLDNIV